MWIVDIDFQRLIGCSLTLANDSRKKVVCLHVAFCQHTTERVYIIFFSNNGCAFRYGSHLRDRRVIITLTLALTYWNRS